MATIGITGKRQRKKPKYLRDDEEDEAEQRAADTSGNESKAKPPKAKKKKREKSHKADKEKPSEIREHKPHKIKKHESEGGIKLKFTFGGKTVGTSVAVASPGGETPTTVQDDSDDVDIEGDETSQLTIGSDDEPIKTADKDDDTSDEEREWLEAIESGEIEHYEKKKAEKNPTALTARQRRLKHGDEIEQLIELPSQYKSKGEMTEEQLAKRQQRAVKRRQQAKEKNEKAKKQTVDRLLKKQSESDKKAKSGKGLTKKVIPHIRYYIKSDQHSISMETHMQFPLQPKANRSPPKVVLCGVKGCKNPKKYNCSKTCVPLCSLACYKKNLLSKPNGTSR